MGIKKPASPQTRELQNKPGQPPVSAQLHRPGAAQPNMPATLQLKRQPAAPPVYRPQPLQKALQTKALPQPSAIRQTNAASAAYRPQPVPLVLQAKKLVAPPVYKPPQSAKPEPPKFAANASQNMATARAVSRPAAPAVYRHHQSAVKSLQMKSSGASVAANRPTHHPAPTGAYPPQRAQAAVVQPRVTAAGQAQINRMQNSNAPSAQAARPVGLKPSHPAKALTNGLTPPSPAHFSFQPIAARMAGGGIIQRSEDEKKTDDKKKKKIVTRILRVDQLRRSNIGITSTRRSARSLERNLPATLTTSGSNTDQIKGLYSFMRQYGGAGLQGVHRDRGNRPKIVRSVLEKMKNDRTTRSSRGPKFAMVAIDTGRIEKRRVLDLNKKSLKKRYSNVYGGVNGKRNFMGMYKTHQKEGVVAIEGSIPRDAIIALRAFRGVPTEEEMEQIINEMIASEEEDDSLEILDEEGSFTKPNNNNDRFDPPTGGSGMAVF